MVGANWRQPGTKGEEEERQDGNLRFEAFEIHLKSPYAFLPFYPSCLCASLFPFAFRLRQSYYSAMAALSREQFVEQVLKVVPARFPRVNLARGDHPFSLRVNGNMVSLENIYRVVVLQPEDSKHHIERWMVELLRAGEGTPDRNGSFDELRPRILPMLLPEASFVP